MHRDDVVPRLCARALAACLASLPKADPIAVGKLLALETDNVGGGISKHLLDIVPDPAAELAALGKVGDDGFDVNYNPYVPGTVLLLYTPPIVGADRAPGIEVAGGLQRLVALPADDAAIRDIRLTEDLAIDHFLDTIYI